MAARLSDPIFVGNVEYRRVLSEPRVLTRMRLGLSKPRRLREAILQLAGVNPAVADTRPYENDVRVRARNLKHRYAMLSADQLEALIASTLEHPPYYRHKNLVHYKCDPGEQPADLPHWVDFMVHMDAGLVVLAEQHRLVSMGLPSKLTRPSPEKLERVAWIPKDTWNKYFGADKVVVFRAPMSASETAQWKFLKQSTDFQQKHVPCCLIFDKGVAKRAAYLSEDDCPISHFGSIESEWTLPSSIRCRVVDIQESSRTTSAGQKVQNVRLQGVVTIPPLTHFLNYRDVPSQNVVLGAMLVAASTECPTPASSAIETLLNALGEQVALVDPQSITVRTLSTLGWLISGSAIVIACPVALAGLCAATGTCGAAAGAVCGLASASDVGAFFGVTAMAFAGLVGLASLDEAGQNLSYEDEQETEQAQKKARIEIERTEMERRRDAIDALMSMNLKSMKQEELEEAAGQVSLDPAKFCDTWSTMRESFSQEETRSFAWAQMVVFSKLIGYCLTADKRLSNVYTTLQEVEVVKKTRDFLDVTSPCTRGVEKTLESEDTLRFAIACTRLGITLGSPDAGKTTFLKQVYGIDAQAGLDEEGRTGQATFYPHPGVDSGFSSAYVVDVPGYGDDVEARNDIVKLLAPSVVAMPGTANVMWIMAAGRTQKSPADELFEKIFPLCSVIIVTQVDKRVKDLVPERMRKLRKAGQLDEEDKVREELMNMLCDVKEEVKARIQTLCGNHKPPPIMFAVLSAESWASTEDIDDAYFKEDPPRGWDTAKQDVQDFFPLRSATTLRALLDHCMGII